MTFVTDDDLAVQLRAVRLMTEDEIKAAPKTQEEDEAGFGALKSERGLFPLRSVKVSAKLSGLSSHITLDQTFLNSYDTPLEATYIFPLPAQAAVTSFRLEVKNRVVEGVIKERGEARQEYTQAIQSGHRAAIAEEERDGVFTIRVGNIEAGELASVRLTMAAPLPFTDGEATFRFPLLVAPRYIPGVRLSGPDVGSGAASDTNETPDASRITPPQKVMLPGFQDPVQLSIEVDFDVASLPVSNVRSSLHTVLVTDVDTDASGAATSPTLAIRRLRLSPTGDCRLNRDFILRFNVTNPGTSDGITSSLVLSDDLGGDSKEGTWQLTMVPPPRGATAPGNAPRDVAFVIDRSGSMDGWKMVAARSATARVVETLTDADRFTILAFDDIVEAPSFWGVPSHFNGAPSYPPGRFTSLFGNYNGPPIPKPNAPVIPATYQNKQRAAQFLSALNARGGTEMIAPLEQAADALQGLAKPVEGSGGFWGPRGVDATRVRDRVLVLVTDGQVGNEDWILGRLGPRLEGVRIFTLGIDQSVNEGFLRRLAALTPGGACELVESQGRLEYAMDRIHRLISTPLLTDVQIDGPSGADYEPVPDSVAPTKVAGLFPGVPVVVRGRYRKAAVPTEGTAFLTVSARTAAGENGTEVVLARKALDPALGALWARARIRDLDDRFAIASTNVHTLFGPKPQTPNPDKPDELRARILETSLRFKVLSRFSAFVAVDRTEKVSVSDGLTKVTQPVDPPNDGAYSHHVQSAPGHALGLFGGSSSPAFGASSCMAFGAPPSSAFGSVNPGFGGSNPGFGGPTSGYALGGYSCSPVGGFGAASSTPAFGGAGLFGSSYIPYGASPFGANSTPAFGSSPFGASTPPGASLCGASPGSAFGGPPPPPPGSSRALSPMAYNQPVPGLISDPFGPPKKSNLFGAPSPQSGNWGPPSNPPFGAPSTQSGNFGWGSSESAFGAPPSRSVNLGASSNALIGVGNRAPPSQSGNFGSGQGFGASGSGAASGLFGANTGSGSVFGGNLGYGSASTFGANPGSGTASTFGANPGSGSASIFGANPGSGTSSLFGANPGSGTSSLFGANPGSGTSSTFGANPGSGTASTFGANPVSGALFGANPTSGSVFNPNQGFGSPVTSPVSASPFGSSGLFGKAPTQGGSPATEPKPSDPKPLEPEPWSAPLPMESDAPSGDPPAGDTPERALARACLETVRALKKPGENEKGVKERLISQLRDLVNRLKGGNSEVLENVFASALVRLEADESVNWIALEAVLDQMSKRLEGDCS